MFYEDILKDTSIDANDFVITLPLKDVKTANLFEEDVYEAYFAPGEEHDTVPPSGPVSLKPEPS